MYHEYFNVINKLLKHMEDSQGDSIIKAGRMVGEVLADGKAVYTFGSGHSQLLAREITGRAGGLFPVFHLPDPIWGMVEQLEGYGQVLLKRYPMKPGEVLFVISNSGRNPEPIEFAMGAKEIGLKVIAVTSLEHSKGTTSRHSSGKKLYEIADIVLDNGVPKGDASMSFEGLPVKAGPSSTILGAAIMNAPVYLSFNVDGSEEHNRKLAEAYKEFAWAPYYFF
jgi:uncharacterized phosphosugar-binding protein